MNSLKYIKKGIQNLILNEGNQLKKEKSDPFNNLHLHVNKKEINNFRLSIFRKLNNLKDIRLHYFKVASPFIEMINGNELVMQKKKFKFKHTNAKR